MEGKRTSAPRSPLKTGTSASEASASSNNPTTRFSRLGQRELQWLRETVSIRRASRASVSFEEHALEATSVTMVASWELMEISDYRSGVVGTL